MVRLEKVKILLNAFRSIIESVATAEDDNFFNHYQMFVVHLKTLFNPGKIDPFLLDSKKLLISSKEKEY